MSDTLKPEEASAVEDAPALTPRSDLPQSPASRPGGSPYRDEIDELVDESLSRGPNQRHWIGTCPYCCREWHGRLNDVNCQGSHIRNSKGRNEIREQSVDRDGHLPSGS